MVKVFAVVADEVRKLAELSASSENEILTIIQSMRDRIHIGVKLSNNLGEALVSIIKGVQNSTNLITEITKVMSQQFTGALEINKSTIRLLAGTTEVKESITKQASLNDEDENDAQTEETRITIAK